MYRSSFIAFGFLLLVQPQSQIQVAPFSSIELPDGGHAVVRQSPTQRVTIVKGSRELTRIEVDEKGSLLVIDRCDTHCPRGYELEVEILTPSVNALSISNGGYIRTAGAFATQPEVSAHVAHGGTIDIRSMSAAKVNARVEQGGRILTTPQSSLTASVYQGGLVLYWGKPRVQRSIRNGGVIQRGTAEDLSAPLADVGPAVVPVVPPVPVRY